MDDKDKNTETLPDRFTTQHPEISEPQPDAADVHANGPMPSRSNGAFNLPDEETSGTSDPFTKTETIDLSTLFKEDMTSTGSFSIRGEIWETTFGKLLRALPIPTFLVDESFRVIAANEACGRLSEAYLPAVDAPFSRIFPGAFGTKTVEPVLDRAFSTRRPQVLEAELDIFGTRIWGRMTFRSIRIKRKRFILVLLEDLTPERREIAFQISQSRRLRKEISRRKEAESKLTESEKRYRQIIENASDVIFRTDANGYFTYVNQTALKLSQYSRDELVGKHFLELIRPDFREATARFLKSQYDEKKLSAYHEFPAVGKDGKTVWLGQHVQLMMEGPRIIGFQAIARNITDRVDAEEALRRAYGNLEEEVRTRTSDLEEAKKELEALNRLGLQVTKSLSKEVTLRHAIEEVASILKPDIVMLFLREDENLVLKQALSMDEAHAPHPLPVHRVGECLCGLAVTERRPVLSKNIYDDPRCTWSECKEAGLHSLAAIPLGNDEEILGVLAMGSHKEQDFSKQIGFLDAIATQITIGLKNALLFEQVRNHAQVLDEKLSIITKSEQEKNRLQAQLLQAQKMEAVGTLAGGIAHDFNNLLQAILGSSDLLLATGDRDAFERRNLEVIQQAARDGADLVSRILTFSRKAEPKTRPTDLNEEIRRAKRLLRRTIPRMIEIKEVLADNLGTIDADPGQVEQMLLNLAVNAQHAMPDGGLLLLETENVSLSDEYLRTHLGADPGHYVLLTVSDNGVGMEPEVMDRIFDPFFTTKTNGEGTGLGLSMVHGMVSLHGGHMRCYSEPGRGTSFKIYFPVSTSDMILDVGKTREMPAFGTETILLVDDDDRLREMERQVVEIGGYKVITARNGEEAVETYAGRREEISLVILDLIMPGMGGERCLKELLAMDPDIKVLVSSGYSPNGLASHEVPAGARAFICKPYDAKDILGAIRRVLDEGGSRPGIT
ncbi:MAG: PAS domain S-box protein [Pseudomonadota bacterium]